MAALGESQKARRRLTTYGKPSRRALHGLQGTESPVEPEVVDETNAGVPERLSGRIRKDVGTLACKPSPTSSQCSATEAGTSAPRSSIPVLRPSDDDLYDVPSSDEGRPPNRSRPLAKKRKVQIKPVAPEPPKGRRTTMIGFPSNSAALKILPSPSISVINKPKARTYAPNQSQSPGAVASRLEAIHNRHEVQKSTSTTTQVHDSSVRRDSSSEAEFLPGTDLVYEIAAPRTPPRSVLERSRARTPKPTQRLPTDAETYLSPSGLDIRGINLYDFSQVGSQSTPQRGKIKDRLAAKNGVRRIEDSDSSSEETDDDGMELDTEKITPEVAGMGDVASREAGRISENAQDTGLRPISAAIPQLIQSNGPRFTYAARQRTLRKEESSDDVLLSLGMIEESRSGKPTARRLGARSAAFPPTSTPGEADSENGTDTQTAVLQTIHELRQAGGNARVFGQAETILDDIESTSASLRRNGLLELATKLQDPIFRSQFTANGLEARLLAQVTTTTELLSDVLLSLSLIQILAATTSPHVLAQFSEQVTMSFYNRLLDEIKDVKSISKSQRSTTTKAFQKDTEKLIESLHKSSIWRYGRPTQVTPVSISLQCMEYLIRNLREARSTQEILDQRLIDHLLQILISTIPMPAASGTPVVQDETDVMLALSVLESSTIASTMSSSQHEGLWAQQSLEHAARFLTFVHQQQAIATVNLRTLVLRLCLNLTSGNTRACKLFSTSGIVDALLQVIDFNFNHIGAEFSEEHQKVTLDNLILSLGFLINLVDRNEKAGKLFLVTRDKSRTPLDTLLQLFASRWQRAFEVVEEGELRTSIPVGYLTVLLSYLSLDASIRTRVASQLQGGTLNHLLVAVGQFLSYFRITLAEEIRTAEGEVDVKEQFVARLQGVVDKLKAEEGHANATG